MHDDAARMMIGQSRTQNWSSQVVHDDAARMMIGQSRTQNW